MLTHMWSSYAPKGNFPRVIRFVQPGRLGADVLSLYNREQNLLLVDQEKYLTLTPSQARAIERTHRVKITLPDLELDQFDLFDDTETRWHEFTPAAE